MGRAVGVMPGLRREDVRPPATRSFVTGVPAFIGFVVTPAGSSPAPLPARQVLTGPGVPVPGDGASLLPAAVAGFFANGGRTCVAVWAGLDDGPVAAVRTALAALEDLDDVDLLALPDLAATALPGAAAEDDAEAARREVVAAQRAVLEHCALRGDRFAVLDALPAATPAVLDQVAALTGPDGGHGALYHPWLLVAGPAGTRPVPPCGHVAGTYAAFDAEVGVHRAPANRPLEQVLDVVADLGGAEAERLHDAGGNPVVPIGGRGVRVRGARTLSTAPEWRAVPARRVVSTLTRWVEQFLASAVHEPNDIRLWVRVMRELTAALDALHRAGAFAGSTAAESFYVKCDHETNPPEVVAAGMVVTEVGVALAAPAEFIVVRVVQGADGVTVNAA